MIPSFLITLREVIEASLIVATILGILTKLNQKEGIRTVWMATGAAALVSIVLLGVGSVFGIKVQELYSGKIEEFIEGILMMLSAVFITWAVFFLHTYFAQYKTHILVKIKQTVEKEQQRGLFWLAFTAVFREGFEIVIFLSTTYFSSNLKEILAGFFGGLSIGILISFGFYSTVLRVPIPIAFRFTNIFLILIAAYFFAQGIRTIAQLLPVR